MMAVPTPDTEPTPALDNPRLIDRLLDEGAVGVCEIARLAGKFRRGRPTHASTVTRWITVGVVVGGGRVLKLEGIRLNGRWVSSRAALVRFIAAQQTDSPNADARPAPARVGRSARQSRDGGAWDAKFEAAGF